MSNFIFALPTRVVFGAGAVDEVGPEGARLGRRALLVTGSTFARRSGLIDRLRSGLTAAGVDVTLFDGLSQDPTVETIDAGAALARETDADLVVGVGGGSALDAAKAIAAGARSQRPIWEHTRHAVDIEARTIDDALPLMQVPMIASTGSETNSSAVVFNRELRMRAVLDAPALFARVAIVDPTITFTVPAHFTAVGAMNIVSQLLEAYLTGDEFAIADRVTEGVVRVVMDSISQAMRHPDDLDARSNLSWAAAMAATAVAGRAGSIPLRALAYPLTARFDVEHGTALAGLWPSYMRYALANRYRLPQVGRFKRYALMGRQVFGVHETDDEVAAEIAIYRFVSWLRSMDMPTDLRQIGIENTHLEHLADSAVIVSGNGRRLPSGLGIEDIEHIYEGALRPF